MNRYSAYIILLAFVLLWTGCNGRDDVDSERNAPMTLSICLPAAEVHAASMCGPRRALGDPGTTELFELPRYVYIIIMKKAAGDWSLWEVITEKPAAENWTKKHYVGVLANPGDSIYQYDIELRRLLATPRFDGRVYIIASSVGLTFDKPLNSINSQAAVESLKFASMMPMDENDSIQKNLQHIYSTPYNYEPDGEYYGAFKKEQRVPHLDMVLYHVAAKVDITWSVADSARVNKPGVTPIRLTYMEARRLFNGFAYCFKPMRNEQAALNGDGEGYDRPDIVTASDEGLWWEGRSYFYTIPYIVTGNEDYFPLQMRLCTNGTNKANAYRPTLNMQIDTSNVFVPWLRANFIFKAPLEDKAETKTVNQR